MTTDALLLSAMAASVAFVAILLIEGALRPGYDPVYHTGSELELGERGWVQRANFGLMGGGAFAFAVGIYETLDTVLGAVLVTTFGAGLLVAGVFVPDAIRGYPQEHDPSHRPSRPGRLRSTQSSADRSPSSRSSGHACQWQAASRACGRPTRCSRRSLVSR